MHIRPATLCFVDFLGALCRRIVFSRHALAVMRTSGLFTALLLAAAVPLVVSAQTAGRSNDGLVISSMVGRDLFQFYCASCHGRDGKGSGHATSALKVPPPDLTTLTERNRGTFPAARLEDVIKGGARLDTPAHGSTEMPVWGPIFSGLDRRGEVNSIRIENLISYIRSIQVKAKAAPSPPVGGAAAFEIR